MVLGGLGVLLPVHLRLSVAVLLPEEALRLEDALRSKSPVVCWLLVAFGVSWGL